LLHHESPTKVGTYAYVNPVVAVALGYLIGNEAVGPRTLLGTSLILISVITITTMPKKHELPSHENEDLPSTLGPAAHDPETGPL
jgi:drug/metabolite transporter (DMT)-like permease